MNNENRERIAWEIVKRMDDIIPKYWEVKQEGIDKPGTYCFELREMIEDVIDKSPTW